MIKPYIKNETAVDIICSICDRMYPGMGCEPADCEWMKMLAEESVDAVPVVYGKWIVRFDGPYNRRRCYCSHCGKHNGVGGIAQNQEKPYCPNCGAKMNIKDGGDNDAVD